MGTQQLLLLAVAFVVVVLMIFAGTSIFNSYLQTTNRDNLLATMNLMANQAQQYYRKPTNLGGGGNTFDGFTAPDKLLQADYGRIRVRIRNNRINLVGIGVETGYDGQAVVRVRAVVRPDRVDVTIIN